MNISKFLTRAWLVRLLMAAVAGSALYWCIETVRERSRLDSLAPVGLSGVHHLGDHFNVPAFYVERQYYGNVGREGGGGANTCCVLLPKKWQPGYSLEVRWSIADWSMENRVEIEAGNYRSIDGKGMSYIALVPVERYEIAEHVWVHFFAGGRVRIVSNSSGSWGAKHPIHDGDPHAADSATLGRRVATLFSAAELAVMRREDVERKRTDGDWR